MVQTAKTVAGDAVEHQPAMQQQHDQLVDESEGNVGNSVSSERATSGQAKGEVKAVMQELDVFFNLAGHVAAENEALQREVADERRKAAVALKKAEHTQAANAELQESLAAAQSTVMRLRDSERRLAAATGSEVSLRAELQAAKQETRTASGEVQRLCRRCGALEARQTELLAKLQEVAAEKRQVELRARRMLRADRFSSSTVC